MKKLSIDNYNKDGVFLFLNELVDEVNRLNKKILLLEGKGTKKKGFVLPTPKEITDYGKENGYRIDGDYIFKYYNDAEWKDSKGNSVLNWKQKVRGVWFKEDKKIAVASTTFTPNFKPA